MAQDPKQGWRFSFGGVNLTSVPDSLPPEKFASALNIRAYSPQSIRTRPGYSLLFHCGNNAVTDVQSYTAIGTDNLPRYLARDSAGNVWLDGGANNNQGQQVGNLAGPQGAGASLNPWRPSQSPQTWLYASSQNDYQKFSAPDANNNVIQYKVGIAEPQIQLEAAPVAPMFTNFTGNASNWNSSGTAGNTSNNNILTDTAGTPLADPVIASRLSVPVSIPYYLVGSLISGNNTTLEVQDVIPPIANCNITAIRYSSGNNGHCQIVCGPLPIGEGPTSPNILGALRRGAIVHSANNSSNENLFVLSATPGPNGSVMFEANTNSTRSAGDNLSGLQVIVVDGNVTAGDSFSQPSVAANIGGISGTVNTSFASSIPLVTWVAGSQFTSSMVGGTIFINSVAFQVGSVASPTQLQVTSNPGNQTNVPYTFPSLGGNGTLTQTLATNPFATPLGGTGTTLPTEDDYIRMVVLVSDLTDFQKLEITFICGTYGSFSYTQTSIDNVTNGQLAIIEFPISALTQSGLNFSLADCTSVEVTVTTTASQPFALASLSISGGGLPDIGDAGAPYQYQLIPRSTPTGAEGNPNPTMRYGVSPRRQNVLVPLPTVPASLPPSASGTVSTITFSVYWVSGTKFNTSGAWNGLPIIVNLVKYTINSVLSPTQLLVTVSAGVQSGPVGYSVPGDLQVNIWDVYRYGGSVTSYRYIGSGLPGTNFTDKYFDDTAKAGQPLPAQNYEPWPSVDVPWSVTAGGGISITVTGSQIVVSGYSAWPATIDRWLPGTLLLLSGQTAYTLRNRPTQLSATSYLFDCQEAIGSMSPTTLSVAEPNVARQFAQYVWGPDANGYFFAVGDSLRPGVIYFATPNAPDITASTNTNEPSTPSELLLNGAILDGLSFVASSDRWWAMYPAFSSGAVFEPFQKNVGRGLAAPRGICSDKINIYFVAKDGICATGGAGFQSLTDDDLYLLFPHEDVQGVNITRNGVTYYAPDYSRAATFRLTHNNGWLKFYYQDSTGTPRTLICFLKTKAWSQDQYANPIISETALVQPEGTLTSSQNENYGLAVLSDNAGNVYQPSLTAGDDGADISAVLAPFEWSGDPFRNSGLWEDFYLDLIPVSGMTAQLCMFGQPQASIPATVIAASGSRQLVEVSVPDGSLNRFLGLQLNWTDAPGSSFTVLYTWRSFSDPDSVLSWQTRALTFGMRGYIQCGRMEAAYSSTATIKISFTAFDGTSAGDMTLPSTNGVIQKILLTPTFNKAQMFTFSASSSAPFQLFPKEFLLWVKQWGDKGAYRLFPLGAEESVKP